MNATALLAAALARPNLSERSRAFLLDVNKRAARFGLTEKQRAAVERIANGRPVVDFAAVNSVALARLPDVLARLLPGGRAQGAEWHAGSLQGERGNSLRVRLRGPRAGAWMDFATGEKGGDPVSLAAAVGRISQGEAAERLAKMLGLGGTTNGQ